MFKFLNTDLDLDFSALPLLKPIDMLAFAELTEGMERVGVETVNYPLTDTIILGYKAGDGHFLEVVLIHTDVFLTTASDKELKSLRLSGKQAEELPPLMLYARELPAQCEIDITTPLKCELSA